MAKFDTPDSDLIDFLERIKLTEDLQDEYAINSTAIWQDFSTIPENLLVKEFTKSSATRIGLTLLTLAVLIATIGEQIYRTSGNNNFISGYFLLGFLALLWIQYVYFSKSIRLIHIDDTGLYIDKKEYLWKDIYGTAILSKGDVGSKRQKAYLIVAFHDMNTYEKFDLAQFFSFKYNGFHSVLANYIEYFKSKAINSHTNTVTIHLTGSRTTQLVKT